MNMKGILTMLTAYKHSTNNDIVETTLDHSASWINVVEPDRGEKLNN